MRAMEESEELGEFNIAVLPVLLFVCLLLWDYYRDFARLQAYQHATTWLAIAAALALYALSATGVLTAAWNALSR